MESRTEEILQAMIDNTDSSELQSPDSRIEELLILVLDKMNNVPGSGAGSDGVTFTPSVSSAGVISWTNNGHKTNPASVDLTAAVIAALPSATGVSF